MCFWSNVKFIVIAGNNIIDFLVYQMSAYYHCLQNAASGLNFYVFTTWWRCISNEIKGHLLRYTGWRNPFESPLSFLKLCLLFDETYLCGNKQSDKVRSEHIQEIYLLLVCKKLLKLLQLCKDKQSLCHAKQMTQNVYTGTDVRTTLSTSFYHSGLGCNSQLCVMCLTCYFHPDTCAWYGHQGCGFCLHDINFITFLKDVKIFLIF